MDPPRRAGRHAYYWSTAPCIISFSFSLWRTNKRGEERSAPSRPEPWKWPGGNAIRNEFPRLQNIRFFARIAVTEEQGESLDAKNCFVQCDDA